MQIFCPALFGCCLTQQVHSSPSPPVYKSASSFSLNRPLVVDVPVVVTTIDIAMSIPTPNPLRLGEFLFQRTPLWGNKNWPPSIKMKELKNVGNKIGSKGCKWSNLNAPCTQFTQVGRIPLSHFQRPPLCTACFNQI